MNDNELAKFSMEGDKKSLEKLIHSIQPLIFNLAIRFLWKREDAEDATQEILIKIITNLYKFDGKSKFSTWAYRVGINYLINLKQTNLEKTLTSFQVFADDLSIQNGAVDYDLPDRDILEKEMKTGCTLAMLQCLNRELRIAFIVGSILKIKSNIAAEIIQTSPENFRKRLEISRKLIGAFLKSNCGVYNNTNPCRCNKRIQPALSCGRINKNNLNFADKLEYYNHEMEELNSLTGIYQNHGQMKSDFNFIESINSIIKNTKIINAN